MRDRGDAFPIALAVASQHGIAARAQIYYVAASAEHIDRIAGDNGTSKQRMRMGRTCFGPLDAPQAQRSAAENCAIGAAENLKLAIDGRECSVGHGCRQLRTRFPMPLAHIVDPYIFQPLLRPALP